MIHIKSIRFVRLDPLKVLILITGHHGINYRINFVNKSIGIIHEPESINPLIQTFKPVGCNLIAIILTNMTYLKSPNLENINGFIDIHLESI